MISQVHGMYPACWGGHKLHQVSRLGQQQSSKIMPVCLLPPHQCTQNEPLGMCDKVVNYCLAFFLLLADSLGI